jgi:hypothetical protein
LCTAYCTEKGGLVKHVDAYNCECLVAQLNVTSNLTLQGKDGDNKTFEIGG